MEEVEATDMRKKINLHHVPGEQLPWQWLADTAWIDPHLNVETRYIVALKTRDEAISYGRRAGFNLPIDE